jgi:hypothetical protein
MGLNLSRKPYWDWDRAAWEQQLRKRDPFFLLHVKQVYAEETGTQLESTTQEAVLSEIRRTSSYQFPAIHQIYAKALATYDESPRSPPQHGVVAV